MLINDARWNGAALDILDVYNFPSEEQEVTVAAYRNEDFVKVYCSDNTYITKILKIANHDSVKVLTVSSNGGITSIETILDKRKVLFRNVPRSCKDKLQGE